MADATIAGRVADGVAWLDQRDPDWWREDAKGFGSSGGGPIDLAELQMDSPCGCILGQRWGWYYAAPISVDEAVACGFDADANWVNGPRQMVIDAEFTALAEEWTRVITERREAEAARVRAACCPCRGEVCEPGCTCADCPHHPAEVVDDDE